MLILQRKPGQSLQIGDDIIVSVVSVENNRVRLSVSAPNNVSILRSELFEAKLTNQESIAEQAAPEALLSLFTATEKAKPSETPGSDKE